MPLRTAKTVAVAIIYRVHCPVPSCGADIDHPQTGSIEWDDAFSVAHDATITCTVCGAQGVPAREAGDAVNDPRGPMLVASASDETRERVWHRLSGRVTLCGGSVSRIRNPMFEPEAIIGLERRCKTCEEIHS